MPSQWVWILLNLALHCIFQHPANSAFRLGQLPRMHCCHCLKQRWTFTALPFRKRVLLPKRRTSTTRVCKLPLQPNLTGCSLKIHLSRNRVADFEQSIQSPHTSPKSKQVLDNGTLTFNLLVGLFDRRSICSFQHTYLYHCILLLFDRSYSNVIYGYVTGSCSENILLSTFGRPTDGAADDTASLFAALANTSDSTLLSTIAIQQRLAQDVSSSSTFVLPPLVPPRLPHRVEQQLRNLQTLYQTVQDNEGQSSGSSPRDESKNMNREDKTLQQPFAEFMLFPTLPVELRLKIWNHTLPGPRLLEVYYCETSHALAAPESYPLRFEFVWSCDKRP